MMEVVLTKGRKDVMKPLLLKLGLAFAVTFAGYLFSHLRTKRIRHSPPQSPGRKDGIGGRAGLKDDLGLTQSAPEIEEMPQTPEKAVDRVAVGFSPTSINSTGEDGFLLPEFDELIHKGFEETGFSPTMRNADSIVSKTTDEETTVMEQEIINLRNMVQVLRDREKNLEIQLYEYYGLKEQEAIVRELQNRLKINTMEAQLFKLKIESLQAENRRLEVQVSDYSKTTAELESARVKIKQLKRMMRSDGEHAKEQLSALHQRVTALQDQERRAAMTDAESQKKLQRLNDLEGELTDFRRENKRLQYEKSELTLKLESAMPTSSALEGTKAQAAEEATRLRQANGDLEKEIERLQTDRCADVEELVYLRWVNACLRYELRNYQPPPGKTAARALSKTLSPKSEEKAKQLILEYANNSGFDESGFRLIDFDSECCSSSQASTLTESEIDDTSLDVSSSTKNSTSNKAKFFSKLKRLVLGKDNQNNNNKAPSVDKTPTSCGTSGRLASIGSLDEMMGACSFNTISSCTKVERSTSDLSLTRTEPLYDSSMSVIPLKETESRTEDQQSNIRQYHSTARLSLDIQRRQNLSLEEIKGMGSHKEQISDVGSSCVYKRTGVGEGGVMELVHENHQLDLDHENTPEKQELRKYAQALSGSRRNAKLRRRSASFASF